MRVAGPDAESFLQGQFTNELRGLAPGEAVYGLWLSLKGKVEADSFVLRGANADEFWIASYFSPGALLHERLERFIIADDVTLEDRSAAVVGFSVWGDSFAQRADALPAGVLAAFPGRRGAEPNIEWIVARDSEAPVVAALSSARELPPGELERRRIEAGIPAVPRDVGPGDLPNEAGLDAVAISYTKGCYLGQEVMARLKSMGRVRRRLLRVAAGSGDPSAKITLPALPVALFVGERNVGELRSTTDGRDDGVVGLAMLSLLHLNADTPLALAPGGAPVWRLLDAP